MKSAGVASAVLATALLALTVPAAAELRTQTVDYKHGNTPLEGYLAYDDATGGKRPGVLLLHRRDGMTDLTHKNTEMLAKLGYVAFAPDMFGKTVRPKDVKEMIEQSASTSGDQRSIGATQTYLDAASNAARASQQIRIRLVCGWRQNADETGFAGTVHVREHRAQTRDRALPHRAQGVFGDIKMGQR